MKIKIKILNAIITSLFVLFLWIESITTVSAQKNVQLDIGDPCSINNVNKIFNQENYKYNIYPNPNNGSFTFEIKSNNIVEKVELQIFNSMGLLIIDYIIKPTEVNYIETINLRELTSGMYFVHFFDEKNTYSEKIIINK